MNKLKNSKIILVLSVLLVFLVMGSASAVDETGNETISTPENNGVDTLSQSMDSVDDGVSAADSSKLVANDTSKTNEMLGLSNDDILSADDVGNYTELNTTIKSSENEVKLTKNYQYVAGDVGTTALTTVFGGIVIDKDGFILDGDGHSIDAKHTGGNYNFRTLNIVANNVVIKNVVFIGGQSNGGAIQIMGNNVQIINCTFRDGGVYNRYSASNGVYITGEHNIIDNCTFKDNTGTDGSAITLMDTARFTVIKNSVFYNNVVYQYGGAIYVKSPDCEITNCNFTNNKAQQYDAGGAVCLHETAVNTVINYSNFTSNAAKFGGALSISSLYNTFNNLIFDNNQILNGGHSPAVYSNAMLQAFNNCTFKNHNTNNAMIFMVAYTFFNGCEFTGNTISTTNGLIYISNQAYVGFTDCNFTKNKGNQPLFRMHGDGLGSGLLVVNNSNITENDFTSNIFDHSGSAGEKSVILNNVNIKNNNASSIFNLHRLNINDSIIEDNILRMRIISVGAHVVIDNTEFINNTVGEHLAYIYPESIVNNSKFINNTLTSSSAYVICPTSGELEYVNAEFSGNTRPDYPSVKNLNSTVLYVGPSGSGSGSNRFDLASWDTAYANIASGGTIILTSGTYTNIYQKIINKKITITGEDNTIITNTHTAKSTSPYNIFRVQADGVVIKNINFQGGRVAHGTIYVNGADYVKITNCTFTSIISDYGSNNVPCGAGIHIHVGYGTEIDHCNFTSIIGSSGAAINFNYVNTPFGRVTNCNFNNINGGNGGAIETYSYAGWFENNTFTKCTSNNNYGGALALYSGSPYSTVLNCTFTDNTAKNYGGAIGCLNAQSFSANIVNCTFIHNTAGIDGGAIYLQGRNSSVINCYMENNGAKNGAAIHASSTAIYSSISNSTIYKNTASVNGGGVVFMALDSIIDNCNFTLNTASTGGGALYFSATNCNLTNSIFIENNAVNGGAVFYSATNCAMFNSSFNNNSASNYGGAVIFSGTQCSMTDCNFTNNTAKEGGAVRFDGNNCYMGYCTYINNTATQDGGGLCSEATGSTVERCEFINNTAPVGKDFYGHKIPITFIGMTFTSLWLTNIDYKDPDLHDAEPIINYGYGTDQSTPAIWDENVYSFLKKNVHCTIYLVDTINNITEKVLNIPDLEIIGYDPLLNNGSRTGVVDLSGWNHRAFTVNASDVKFTNLTFKNANITDNGGVLRIINDAAVIDNCTFMNNTACNGSAISFESGVVLIIRDSTFINNTALGNGTVYMYDDANSTMTLNSTFMDNTAYLGSAIYYAGPVWYYADGLTLTRLNQTTSNNDTYNGSQPYYEPDWNIFTGFSDDYWQRAKLCLMDVYVNLGAKLDGNIHDGSIVDPTDFGMAFQMVAPTGTIHFVNSSETWNMSELYSKTDATNYKFGVTFEGNNTTLTDFKFINGVYGYDVVISGFHFNNTDSCIEWKARNGTIINSSFTSKDHVAFNLTGENLTVCDSSFTGNGNGALYVDASGLVLSNCTFNNNNISSGVGSHIVLTENANNTRIIDSRFIKGNSTGIWVNATGVSISGSNFTDNTGINGGALILSNGTLVLSDNNFTRNIVSGNGGALLLSNGTLSMSGNNFTYNKADVDGGAVYLENGTLEDAWGNDFWHNRASNNGGALYTNIPVVMDGGVFFNNTADVCGGGIYLNNTNNTLSNMEFSNNTAVNGSAIYVTENNTLNVNNVVLKGNTHTDFTDIDTTVYHGSIYLSNYLSEGLFKDSGLVLGDLQDIWDGTYRLPVIYVNSTGTSRTGGASPETATSLDNALDHLIDGGKIIFTTDYTVEDVVNLSNRNLTLTSNNSSSIIRKGSSGKYLFNPLKKIKNLSLNNYLSF